MMKKMLLFFQLLLFFGGVKCYTLDDLVTLTDRNFDELTDVKKGMNKGAWLVFFHYSGQAQKVLNKLDDGFIEEMKENGITVAHVDISVQKRSKERFGVANRASNVPNNGILPCMRLFKDNRFFIDDHYYFGDGTIKEWALDWHTEKKRKFYSITSIRCLGDSCSCSHFVHIRNPDLDRYILLDL